MDGFRSSIEVAPLQSKGALYGFLLIGRWPQDTVEWAKFLVLAVRMAAVPGLLPISTVFRVREEVPDQPQPGAVGLVVAEGSLMGEHPLTPGSSPTRSRPVSSCCTRRRAPSPPCPSTRSRPAACSCRDCRTSGLEHRAAWVEADVEGNVTQLVNKVGVDPQGNVDTAALALLLAA